MTYVLIIISFVAMGGPKNTTPTIDHIPFSSSASCEAGKQWVVDQLTAKHIHVSAVCQGQ